MRLSFPLLFGSSNKKKPIIVKVGDGNAETEHSVTPKIRVVFMGTPDFSARLLELLAAHQYNIVGVLTKPDMSVGRKQEIVPSPVKQVALTLKCPVVQPRKFDETTIETVRSWKPDLIVVAAYGKILPSQILGLPGFGCLNVHYSLLPRWRGASPVQNTLMAGETETGVTIMLMDEGLDTGDILTQRKMSIAPEDTQETLLKRLSNISEELLLETIPRWVKREITPIAQDAAGVTLCQLIEREDGRIIWTDDAESIFNRYRALAPWPGIFAFWKWDDGIIRLKLHRVSFQKQTPQNVNRIGQIFELGEKIGVQTGQGVIFLDEVQQEGKTRLPIAEFLLGNKAFIGSSFL